MEWKEVGIIYGAQFVGKGLTEAFDEVDRQMGKAALSPEQRPSTWLNVGVAVALPLLTRFVRVSRTLEDALIIAGGYCLTKLWDIAKEMQVRQARVARTPTPVARPPTPVRKEVEVVEVPPAPPVEVRITPVTEVSEEVVEGAIY